MSRFISVKEKPDFTRSGQTRSVLVADQEPTSRELLRILLEHQGCKVSEAGDGPEAVAVARKILPDLIFLDLELPLLDGYATVRAMRCDVRLQRRSIVAMMASASDGDPDRLREAGFSAHILKPVVLRKLSGQLAKLLPEQPGR